MADHRELIERLMKQKAPAGARAFRLRKRSPAAIALEGGKDGNAIIPFTSASVQEGGNDG